MYLVPISSLQQRSVITSTDNLLLSSSQMDLVKILNNIEDKIGSK